MTQQATRANILILAACNLQFSAPLGLAPLRLVGRLNEAACALCCVSRKGQRRDFNEREQKKRRQPKVGPPRFLPRDAHLAA